MTDRKGTFLYGLSADEVAALREIAAVAGETITRGAGTGGGSMAGLMKAIAQAYRAQPDRVLYTLVGLTLHRPYTLPEKYRMQDEDEGEEEPERDVCAELDELRAEVARLKQQGE